MAGGLQKTQAVVAGAAGSQRFEQAERALKVAKTAREGQKKKYERKVAEFQVRLRASPYTLARIHTRGAAR